MGKCLEAVEKLEQRKAAHDELARRAAQIAAERKDLLALAEQIIKRRADEIEQSETTWAPRLWFDADELAVFDSLAWDAARLRTECGRVVSLARWQAAAGTAAERQAAQAALDAAEAELAKKSPAIEQRIAAAQRELRALTQAREAAAAAVERQRVAVSNLRTLVPAEAREEHDRRLRATAPIRTELAEARARLDVIRTALSYDVETLDGKRAARLVAPDLAEGRGEVLDVAGWRTLMDQWRRELAPLEKRRAELEAASHVIQPYLIRLVAIKTAIVTIVNSMARTVKML